MNRSLILMAGWIGQAMAVWLSTLKRPLAAEVAALRERLEKLRSENELLRARLERIEPHRRPFYAPWERLGILLHRARYGLSLEATARAFVVTVQTLLNWTKEVESGVARLVRSRKPLNALPDFVRELSAFLGREWPRWGTRRIAGILAGLGVKASRTSVQRLLRRPPPPRRARRRRGRAAPLHARHVGHVWIVDFTVVRQLFHSIVVGAVLDAWSRRIVALRVWRSEPDSAGACLLVRDAIRRHGRPTWLVSDRGRQFRSARFRSLLTRHRIRRRHAAVGDANLSRLDRFWRSMKEEFARALFLFKPIRTLEGQLRTYARWHAIARPHQGLGLRVPDDIHHGRTRRHLRRPQSGALEVTLLDGDHYLPIFSFRSAA